MKPSRSKPSRPVAAAALLLLLSFAPASHAAVLFSNLGPGDSYDHVFWNWRVGGHDAVFVPAMSFQVSGGSFRLAQVELALNYALGPDAGPNMAQVFLADDAGGIPGATLESFTFTGMRPFGGTSQLVSGDSVLKPTLLDGHRYWIEALAPFRDSQVGWGGNVTGMLGGLYAVNGGPWNPVSSTPSGAFRVSGTPTIPEPSAGLLLLAGLGMLGAFVAGRRSI
jgi:hypothetical protein